MLTVPVILQEFGKCKGMECKCLLIEKSASEITSATLLSSSSVGGRAWETQKWTSMFCLCNTASIFSGLPGGSTEVAPTKS